MKPDAPNVALGEAGASVNGAEVEEANVACNETHVPNGGMTVHVLDGARPLDDPDPEEARSVGFLWIVYADVEVELLRGVANFDEPHLDDREAGIAMLGQPKRLTDQNLSLALLVRSSCQAICTCIQS